MKRVLWMHTLTGQIIGVMLLALGLAYGITLVISHSERQRALQQLRREDCVDRTASIASLLLHTPDELHADVLRSVNSPFNRYWLSETLPDSSGAWQQAAREALRVLRRSNGQAVPHPLFLADDLPEIDQVWEPIAPMQQGVTFQGLFLSLPAWNGMGLVLTVREGLYLSAVTAKSRSLDRGPFNLYASFALSALMLSLASVLVARRIGQPLRRLADLAERMGRGEAIGQLPEEGAREIQRTAMALNGMQARLRRFVEDRTNMIAAISHDLRTPITSLGLRAEFIADPEMREKMLATLHELQVMVDATLAFAREESVAESTRVVDLNSLLASLCDDLAELGWDVVFQEGSRVPFRCRPEALCRAVRNVIENAVRYGERARVSMVSDRDHQAIVIEDTGPGIPQGDHERVFMPFVRLEGSRSRDTGGVGLGLAITRTIVHAHGGEVLLQSRSEGGLRVVIRLPMPARASQPPR